MNLDEVQKIVKIKWNKFYVCKDGGWLSSDVDFGVTPDEFLEFAKQDYNNNDKKGQVGAVTNSKRAIDCQIDWIISYLGYDYLNFNEEKYSQMVTIINDLEKEQNLSKDYSLKLRFIQALEIAPTFLISQIRTIRNKLEHEYMLPSKEKAREAIELADLFINATQNKLFFRFFTDYNIQNEYDSEDRYIRVPSYSIHFDYNKGIIDILYRSEKDEQGQLNLKPTDREYMFFIKAAICCDFYYLVKAFGYNIDRKNVNYEINIC